MGSADVQESQENASANAYYYLLRAEKAYREEAKEDYMVDRISNDLMSTKREISKESAEQGQKKFDQFLIDDIKRQSGMIVDGDRKDAMNKSNSINND